jgi:hypothetical protein
VPPDGATSVYVIDVLTGSVRGWAFTAFRYMKSYPTEEQDPIYGGEITRSAYDSLMVLEGLIRPSGTQPGVPSTWAPG